MKKEFTKKDLHTGDIIENREGERGVVILENDCIIYQAGGLDILDEVFTDDLFIDGPDRSGDIFKVFHDPEGQIGFNKMFGLDPVYVRINDKHTRERAAELSDKYDWNKGKVAALVLEPYYRRYEEIHVNPYHGNDIDMAMSEAPSMTATGQIKIDRTFIPVPGSGNLFLLYNKYQEEWHLQLRRDSGNSKDEEPVIVIPEEGIEVHSRCMIVRKDDAGNIATLQDGDIDKVKGYMVNMDDRNADK